MLRHIDGHLDDDLDLDRLSGVAAFSKHHFHRRFAALFGITVHRYVQLMRLKRASYRLAFRDSPVLEIALDCGYEGPEAFARAFRRHLGQSPSGFRQRPRWTSWQDALQPLARIRTTHMPTDVPADAVTIVTVPATRVAVLEHRGDPATIGDSLRRFIAWRKAAGLPPRLSATFNLFHDDPATTPPNAFRLGLGAAIGEDADPARLGLAEAGLVVAVIPAGRCARLRHTGTQEGLARAADQLCRVWFPQSGETRRDFPLYAQRIAFFPDVPEHEAITDLFLPLA
ncbi:AraC family transcriptional regulator [Azospirillum sp. TSO35-2]|nr:AraC family transcriptional regulator [Azospirillum sp. TSO35-2]